jgi:hypothetical protein
MGQTDVVTEEDEVGDIDEDRWEEWHDGVFNADRPAERAMWRSGTAGSARRVLWVCMKRLERVAQRDWL